MSTGFRDTAFAEIGAVYVREVEDSNPPAEIGVIRVRTATGLEEVWRKATALAVSIVGTAYGGAASSGSVNVETSPVTAAVTGGFPPYTYSWARTDSGGIWSAVAASSAETSFVASGVSAGTLVTSTWECTVTDSQSGSVVSPEITATAENFGTGFIP